MKVLTTKQTIGALIAVARAARTVVASDRATGAALTEVSTDDLVNLETHLNSLDVLPASEGDYISIAEARLRFHGEQPRNPHLAVPVMRVDTYAKLPRYATDGSGCFDLFGIEGVQVAHGETVEIDTGLIFEIPEGHVMLIFSRSGHGFKSDTRLSNCVGVIDSDYRGSVKVKLRMDEQHDPLILLHGRAIAQGIILPFPRVAFLEVDKLSDTARGAGCFGSTDKQ